MFEITCPHCGKTITEDESKFASVVQQVRDREFQKAVDAQAKLMESERASALAAAVAKAKQEAEAASAKEREQAAAELAALKQRSSEELSHQREQQASSLAQAREEAAKERERLAAELARQKEQAASALADARERAAQDAAAAAREALAAQAERDEKIAQLQAKLDAADRERQLATKNALAEANARIAELEQQLKAQATQAEQAQELAVTRASAQLTQERDEARHAASLAEAEKKQAEAKLSEQKAASEQAYKQIVAMKDEEIARIKEMRSRLTTKLIGESLEHHCESEFNRLRATAFRTAEFHKDNETVGGTKGDFIFRDFAPDGTELISIMFEMKTEEDASAANNRRTNESHLKKLDSDRSKKGCEYAVLVSTLEADSELYNQGIVDVSYLYPKMYVIRPQFFIPLISLLRDASLKTVELRQQLSQAKAESLDITNFEAALGEFKNSFALSYDNAAKKFDQAMDDIDKAIRMLEKIKESFRLAEKHLGTANNKADRLTIKRLTRESPSLREKFAELAEAAEAEAEEPAE